MYLPIEQRPATPAHSPQAVPTVAPPQPAGPLETPHGETSTELPQITEELLIEEVSIDGMCGVY